jgi:hypothetical protein
MKMKLLGKGKQKNKVGRILKAVSKAHHGFSIL